jgi:hypothetical protein
MMEEEAKNPDFKRFLLVCEHFGYGIAKFKDH